MARFVTSVRLSCVALLAVAGLHAGVAAARGNAVVLGYDDISKVMEICRRWRCCRSPDAVTWSCQDLDLREYCTDLDGCTIQMHLQHKIDGNDMVRGIKEYLYFENATTSAAKGKGVNGYTRQSAGGEHGWITGTAGQYTLFAPWGWVGGYNYRPAQCPGQNGRNSPAHTEPYLITVISHPHVNATFDRRGLSLRLAWVWPEVSGASASRGLGPL